MRSTPLFVIFKLSFAGCLTFAAKVAEIAGQVAEFLGPAINGLREFLGLKSAKEFKTELEQINEEIAEMEEKGQTRSGRGARMSQDYLAKTQRRESLRR